MDNATPLPRSRVALGEPEDGDEDDDNKEEKGFQEDLPQNYVAGFDTRRRVIETFF